MSEEKKKYKSYLFQKFIAVGRVMSEPELKAMRPFKEGDPEVPYCTFMASTGSPFGTSDDAVFSVMLKGKQAELFCREPRKGETFLFDLQLKTYNKQAAPGQRFGERITSFVGSFSFLGGKHDKPEQPTASTTTPATAPVDPNKKEEDIPF